MNNPIDIQINLRINRNERFAIYRLPGETQCTLIDLTIPKPFLFSMLNESLAAEGFVVFPFDEQQQKGWWFTITDLLKINVDSIRNIPVTNTKNIINISQKGYNEYASNFITLMNALKTEKVKKVILSRIIQQDTELKENLSKLFQLLCTEHPGAFVYLVATPETGTWMGASPELLLNKQANEYTTVALAGTRNLNEMDPAKWNAKEIEEQNVVSSYIDRLLDKTNIGNYKKSGPAITKAGSVTHLKTTYKFSAEGIKDNLGSFLKDLHPTPALGGEPKETAMNLIRKVEKHNRKYYGGFIGPISGKEINLFVNIRCMEIENKNIKIYTGGGLTSDSELLQEWNETILKSQTLLSVINKL